MRVIIEGSGTIKGIRTNLSSGVEKEVEQTYLLVAGSLYKLWFYLKPGETGYESFEFCSESIEDLKKTGWHACGGTKGSWHMLFIPPNEMTKAIDDICEQYTKSS